MHDIAAITNVPSELWRDFERSDVDLWPDLINTSGYVRQYAEAVGLDPEMVTEQFHRLYPQRSNRVEPILKANPSLVHGDSANAQVEHRSTREDFRSFTHGSLATLTQQGSDFPPPSTPLMTRTLMFVALVVSTVLAAACGTGGAREIPYSTLKQHIAKGDVRDVRMSATEVRAMPTEAARQAGAPAMWVATPVPNDAIVPLLESNNITYQGIKSDESHVALILGIARRAHLRHRPRHVVQAHESR